MTLQLLYFIQDEDPAHGRGKGHIFSISLDWPPADRLGKKERPPRMGRTRIPYEPELLERLLSGAIVVDTERTTEIRPVFRTEPMPLRQAATELVAMPQDDWERSARHQAAGDEATYRSYVIAFLEEFTNRIAHIPLREHLRLFPLPLVFPCATTVLVARDGVALLFEAASRPERVFVTIDQTQVLDALLLPHPPAHGYSFPAPSHVDTWVCDDTNTWHVLGRGYLHTNHWGNPGTVILDRRSHGFYEEIRFRRTYADGASSERGLQFAEVFGNTDPENFSIERARARATTYASIWAVRSVTRGAARTVHQVIQAINELRQLVVTSGTGEAALESCLDKYPWMLERALSCAKYHSQVTIPDQILSRSDSALRPDKLVERHDGYIDVLDLKRADVPLIAGKENRKVASSALKEAEAQVDTYQRALEEPAVREYLRGRGLRVLRPAGVVVIGRRPQPGDDWEEVKRRLSVAAHTYDDVLDELQTLGGWLSRLADS